MIDDLNCSLTFGARFIYIVEFEMKKKKECCAYYGHLFPYLIQRNQQIKRKFAYSMDLCIFSSLSLSSTILMVQCVVFVYVIIQSDLWYFFQKKRRKNYKKKQPSPMIIYGFLFFVTFTFCAHRTLNKVNKSAFKFSHFHFDWNSHPSKSLFTIHNTLHISLSILFLYVRSFHVVFSWHMSNVQR